MPNRHLADDSVLFELAARVGEALKAQGLMLATAESCTGGWVAEAVTSVAGSSAWFDCGMAAYSYEAKQALLRVRPETLMEHGAVSRETALEMVSGALITSGASLAVAVTGIAGPGGGLPGKPVGTVCFGWACEKYTQTERVVFAGDRHSVRTQTAEHALRGLLKFIKQL